MICSFWLLGGSDVCHTVSDTVKRVVRDSQSREDSSNDVKLGKPHIYKNIGQYIIIFFVKTKKYEVISK